MRAFALVMGAVLSAGTAPSAWAETLRLSCTAIPYGERGRPISTTPHSFTLIIDLERRTLEDVEHDFPFKDCQITEAQIFCGWRDGPYRTINRLTGAFSATLGPQPEALPRYPSGTCRRVTQQF